MLSLSVAQLVSAELSPFVVTEESGNVVRGEISFEFLSDPHAV
jgi:hypothetical protein